MNKISDKQLKTNRVNFKRYLKNIRGFYDDFFLYASDDFLFNLFYMMIHKKFIWFGRCDYSRIAMIFFIFRNIPTKELKNAVNNLFDCIENEEDIINCIKSSAWKVEQNKENLIITIEEPIGCCNPNEKQDTTKYIVPLYMLHNFLQFKQLFYNVVSKKYDVGPDTDFWLYACRYLLMGDKDYKIAWWGNNGKNFPYKLLEEYNPLGLSAIPYDSRIQDDDIKRIISNRKATIKRKNRK